MITELRIADLGVIKDATIGLDPGLTVVTGETGCGQDDDRQRARIASSADGPTRERFAGVRAARVEGRFLDRQS